MKLCVQSADCSGFDGSLMGGINAMTQYQDFFGYKEVGASTGIGEFESLLSAPDVTLTAIALSQSS